MRNAQGSSADLRVVWENGVREMSEEREFTDGEFVQAMALGVVIGIVIWATIALAFCI